MDVYEVRRANFRELAGGNPDGTGPHGWLQRAADRLGKSHSQITNFGGKNPTKNIGEQVAREIERAYGLSDGMLDRPLKGSGLPTNGTLSPSPELHIDSLAQAVKWIRFEERRLGVYQPERHAERLMSLYRLIEADGGVLSPEHAEAIISQGDPNDAPRREPAAAASNR